MKGSLKIMLSMRFSMTKMKLRKLEESKTKIYLVISFIENNKSIQKTREEIIFERKLKSGLKSGVRVAEAQGELGELQAN